MHAVISERLTSASEQGSLHTFVNLYSYMALRRHSELIGSVDRVLVDGQLLVLVFKLLGIKSLQRKSFDMTSLAVDIFNSAVESGVRVYLVGTTPEAIEGAVKNISDRFPGLNIVGYHHGYLREADDELRVLNDIKSKSVDLVVVGMGAPLQEMFLVKLKSSGWQGTGFTCGGFFHQTASQIDYYPRWINKLHLRWLYRMYDEPKLFKRYFFQYPVALWWVLWDFRIKPILAK